VQILHRYTKQFSAQNMMCDRGKNGKHSPQRLAKHDGDKSERESSAAAGAVRASTSGTVAESHAPPSADAGTAPIATHADESEYPSTAPAEATSGAMTDVRAASDSSTAFRAPVSSASPTSPGAESEHESSLTPVSAGTGTGMNASASGIVSRLITSMWHGSAHPRAAVWNERGMNELLREGRFDPLYTDLLHRLEHDRCIRAATWCHRMALETADVPLLYLVVRNGCRYDIGTVPTESTLRDTLRVFVLLVLRVVQDTVALQRTQGSRAADDIFRVLVQVKLLPWLLNLRPADAWPKLSSVLAEVEQLPIVMSSDKLPDHSWITAVSFTHVSTIRFGTPDPDLRTACRGSSDAVLHRSSVRDHFFSIARAMHWRNFLSAGLGTFIPSDESEHAGGSSR